MILLGIDPGLRATGLVVVERKNKSSFRVKYWKEINTDKEKDLTAKINFLFSSLEKVVRRFKPSVLILEKIYSHYRHPTTIASLAQVRGLILLLAARRNIKVIEYASSQVKKAITSYGSASKEQLRRMVAYISKFNKPLNSEHISDALALVLTYFTRRNDF